MTHKYEKGVHVALYTFNLIVIKIVQSLLNDGPASGRIMIEHVCWVCL